jgi:uncharacterized membrane protein YesL
MGPVEGAPAATVVCQPRISRALGVGLRAAYDCLGTVLIGSLLWVSLAALLGAGGSGLVALLVRGRGFGPALVEALAGIAAAGIGTGPLTAAIFHHTRRVLIHDDPEWWELLRCVPRLWRRGLTLAASQVIVSLVLALDALYFLGQQPMLMKLIGMLFLYPMFFWWGASLLQWPLAVDRAGDSVRLIIKKSFLLLLDNLTYVVLLATVLSAFTALCATTRIGLLFLAFTWAGVGAFLQSAALVELLPKYGIFATAPDETEREGAEK